MDDHGHFLLRLALRSPAFASAMITVERSLSLGRYLATWTLFCQCRCPPHAGAQNPWLVFSSSRKALFFHSRHDISPTTPPPPFLTSERGGVASLPATARDTSPLFSRCRSTRGFCSRTDVTTVFPPASRVGTGFFSRVPMAIFFFLLAPSRGRQESAFDHLDVDGAGTLFLWARAGVPGFSCGSQNRPPLFFFLQRAPIEHPRPSFRPSARLLPARNFSLVPGKQVVLFLLSPGCSPPNGDGGELHVRFFF